MAKDMNKELAQRAKLDAVAQAKERYVIAKSKLEYQLREQLKKELNNLQTQVDITVRYAVDQGCSKASVLRALGTKDYHTLYDSLNRTESIVEPQGSTGLESAYKFDPVTGELNVTYDNHGPLGFSGEATFDYRVLQDGTKWFMARTPLWNEDFTVRNDVVAALDNRQDGDYYDEAVAWVERVVSGK
jgi:hypothetical protein